MAEIEQSERNGLRTSIIADRGEPGKITFTDYRERRRSVTTDLSLIFDRTVIRQSSNKVLRSIFRLKNYLSNNLLNWTISVFRCNYINNYIIILKSLRNFWFPLQKAVNRILEKIMCIYINKNKSIRNKFINLTVNVMLMLVFLTIIRNFIFIKPLNLIKQITFKVLKI